MLFITMNVSFWWIWIFFINNVQYWAVTPWKTFKTRLKLISGLQWKLLGVCGYLLSFSISILCLYIIGEHHLTRVYLNMNHKGGLCPMCGTRMELLYELDPSRKSSQERRIQRRINIFQVYSYQINSFTNCKWSKC